MIDALLRMILCSRPLFSKIYKMVNGMSKLKLPVLPTGQEGFGVSHYAEGEGVR